MAPRICSQSCTVANDAKLKCILCALSYHLECYKIDPSWEKSIGGVTNIQFVCDKCLIKANSDKNTANKHPSLSSTFNELVELKKTVDEIRISVKNTETIVSTKGFSAAGASITPMQSPAVWRNINKQANQQSPIVKMPFKFGTGNDSACDLGRPIEKNGLKESLQKRPSFSKAIFITRLDPKLSTEKVLNYIKSKGVDANETNIECRKLVKLNQNLDELTFCSFKVSTNEELYAKLIEPSFWPASVGIRDFVANNITAKRPAATLSPNNSPSNSAASQNPKHLRTDASFTPVGSTRGQSSTRQLNKSIIASSDIRNFCHPTA